jgi:hypothetical protein
MPITALPTPPSRNDPTNFATRADAFMAALPAFATETNATAVEVDNDRIASAASATNAQTQVGLAAAQVGLATTQVGLASAQRVLAETAASAASATANVTQWVSGTTYALGVNVWSPINAQTYRRIIAGAGTTDPSADSTNWTKISESLVVASQAEMEAGTQTALRSMSPLRVKQAISANIVSGIPFTASGSIASAGKVVALNSNGTVSSVAGQTEALSADAAYTTSVGQLKAVAYNTTGSVILMAYRRSSTARLNVVAGTVSNTTITWGTPVIVDPDNDPRSISVVYVPSISAFFLFFCTGTPLNYLTVSVSGTTPSLSGISLYKTVSGRSDWQKLLYNPSTGALIVFHNEFEGGAYGQYCTACTISGSSLTRGTEQGASQSYGYASITSVGSNRFLLCYGTTSSQAVLSIFVNPSGNTSSIAANNTQVSIAGSTSSAIYDTFNNVVLLVYAVAQKVAYRQVTALSDSAITLGSEVVLTSLNATDSTLSLTSSSNGAKAVDYDSLNRKITIFYMATGGTYPSGGYLVTTAWTAGVLVPRAKVQLTSVAGDVQYSGTDLIYTGDTNNKFLVVYTNNTTNAPIIKFFTNEASTNINTLGIAQSSATNGQTVQVKLPNQIDTNQTGLTAGSTYYVSGDGTLTTSAGTTNFLLGKATSATSLLITKWSQ